MPRPSTVDIEATQRSGPVARPALSPAARGIACLLMAVALFAVFNVLLKHLAATFPPSQLVFVRGLVGLAPLAVLLALDGGGRRVLISSRPWLQVIRAASAFLANVLMVTSYRFMPLADAVAISYAAPIFVTALSVPFLGERVGRHRWAAVAVGFLGVCLVARPGQGLIDPMAGVAVLGALCYAICILATRELGGRDAALTTMIWSTGLFAVFGALTLPVVGTPPAWSDLPLLGLSGLVATAGMFFFVRAYREVEAAVVVPFEYTAMIWAVAFGFLVFGEVPQPTTVAGIAVITGSGLYILHRETRSRRAERLKAPYPQAR